MKVPLIFLLSNISYVRSSYLSNVGSSKLSWVPRQVAVHHTPHPCHHRLFEVLQARLGSGSSMSKSAAARLMAMQKLTGQTEEVDQSMLSRTIATPPTVLVRSNTVSGDERGESPVVRHALF